MKLLQEACGRSFPTAPVILGRAHSLLPVALQHLLHVVELRGQPPIVGLHTLSLPPQRLDVAVEQGLQVALGALAVLVELPLGLQQLVLLLQEAHLPPRVGERDSGGGWGGACLPRALSPSALMFSEQPGPGEG